MQKMALGAVDIPVSTTPLPKNAGDVKKKLERLCRAIAAVTLGRCPRNS